MECSEDETGIDEVGEENMKTYLQESENDSDIKFQHPKKTEKKMKLYVQVAELKLANTYGILSKVSVCAKKQVGTALTNQQNKKLYETTTPHQNLRRVVLLLSPSRKKINRRS